MSAADRLNHARDQLRDVLARLVPNATDRTVIFAAADTLRKEAENALRRHYLRPGAGSP